MSDYLSRAVASVNPTSPAEVRPKLPSLFDPPAPLREAALEAQREGGAITVEQPRPNVAATTEPSSSLRDVLPHVPDLRKQVSPGVLERDAPSSRRSRPIAVIQPAATSPNEPSQPTPDTRRGIPMPATSVAEKETAPPLPSRKPMPVRARIARKQSAFTIEKEAEPSPPAIQITIGRVEVRALPPPAPAKQRSQRPAPRVSLEQYLRSRNGSTA